MSLHTFIMLWCFVSCVKCDGEYEIISSTPVVNVPTGIQSSTDALNPIKVNEQSELRAFTTEADAKLDPTAVNDQIQSTGVANPVVNSDAPVTNQLTTTIPNAPSDGGDGTSVNLTPVLNRLVILEREVENPTFINNSPLTPPLNNTDVVENDAPNPTPVILTLETNPSPIALISNSDNEPELLPSTEVFIEPSKVSEYSAGESVTGLHTINLDQETDQVSSVIPSTYITEAVAPTSEFASKDTGTEPQILTPDKSNSEVPQAPRQPNDIRQFFNNLQHQVQKIWDKISSFFM